MQKKYRMWVYDLLLRIHEADIVRNCDNKIGFVSFFYHFLADFNGQLNHTIASYHVPFSLCG